MNQKPSSSERSEPQKRQRYDEQFKRDAVALIERGRPVSQLARVLGVSHWNLRDWKRLYGARVADLQRELDAIARQRDILKKALAIVAQENPGASGS